MQEGVECMVELVDTSKAVVVIVKGGDEAKENHLCVLVKIVDCVITSMEEFYHMISFYWTLQVRMTSYFHEDSMYV